MQYKVLLKIKIIINQLIVRQIIYNKNRKMSQCAEKHV